jgi:maltodextrin utilization protein YvdJ
MKLNTSVLYLSHVLTILVVMTPQWYLTGPLKLAVMLLPGLTVVLVLIMTLIKLLVLVSISLLLMITDISNVSVMVLLNMMLF